jgi:hypothetical protein
MDVMPEKWQVLWCCIVYCDVCGGGGCTESLSVVKTGDLSGHNAGIFTLGFSRDGRYLASG